MNPDIEIRRLLDVMPASGRMRCKLLNRSNQPLVIQYQPPLPWGDRLIEINFRLWSQLSRPLRDLLILRAVAWLNRSKLIKLDVYQGLTIAGFVGATLQFIQADAVGVLLAGGLTAFSALQIWRNSRGLQVDVDADTEALRVAQRRGYSEIEAAAALLQAISTVATLERRSTLDFNELVRSQNLRRIAGLERDPEPEPLRSP